MSKRLIHAVCIAWCFYFAPHLSAHEGMWIPSTLSQLVMGDMQSAGLKLSAEEIYSINHSSIKDAIVLFGGGCTASVLSDQGLILTNHHCGYSQIQFHSSLENDYLKNGFWAMSRAEELPNPNLTATFVIRIEDVTSQLLEATAGLDFEKRQEALTEKIAELERQATANTAYKADIKPFFYGYAFYMIVTETFNDVRLVGAPPSSIGKFGGDTDNWEWPRHTGDFSIFRIYASSDNEPAEYSASNIPLKPKFSLSINMQGLQEGDFTMVFGFPGSTEQYISSTAVAYMTQVENPIRIAMRESSLAVINRAMETSDKLRIQYAAKQSRISNAYKKWIGQNMGLNRFSAVNKKMDQEMKFQSAAQSDTAFEAVAGVIADFETLYSEKAVYRTARNYLIEYFYYGPEIFRFSGNFKYFIEHHDSLVENGSMEAEKEKLIKTMDAFYKNYDPLVDEQILAAQTPLFLVGCPDILQSSTLKKYGYGGDRDTDEQMNDSPLIANALYSKSIFDNKEELRALMSKSHKKIAQTLAKDPIYVIAEELLTNYQENVSQEYAAFQITEDALMTAYLNATMALFPEAKYWPDANSTLRLTFGKMEGSTPQDGIAYLPYTTLDGAIEKYIPGDKEFDLPEKLIKLNESMEYGPYATDGELRVCFLGSNHTTGGNSGSPALDANGQLVGLNFDRTWESTMSDVMFNGEICRNIMVDIKYVLFIIDKYAHAGHLVDEMNLVSNAQKDQDKILELEKANPSQQQR